MVNHEGDTEHLKRRLDLPGRRNLHVGALTDRCHPLSQCGNRYFPADNDHRNHVFEPPGLSLHQHHQHDGDHEFVRYWIQKLAEP